jgi:hypothetical protein
VHGAVPLFRLAHGAGAAGRDLQGEETVAREVDQHEEEEVEGLWGAVWGWMGGSVSLNLNDACCPMHVCARVQSTRLQPCPTLPCTHQDVLLALGVDVAGDGVRGPAVEAGGDAPKQEHRVREAGVDAGEAVPPRGAEAGRGQPEDQGLAGEVEEEEVGRVLPHVLAAASWPSGVLGHLSFGAAGDGREDFVAADELWVCGGGGG